MPRRIEHSRFDGSADAQHHSGSEANIDARDTSACA